MDHEKIKLLLADKENFKVEKGKVFLKDMFGDWCERVANSLGVIDVRGFKFTMDDVEAAISSNEVNKVLIEMSQEGLRNEGFSEEAVNSVQVVVPVRPLTEEEKTDGVKPGKKYKKKILPFKEGKKLWEDSLTKSEKKKRTALRSAEIKLIRKMLEEKKSINAMAKALGTNRFAVQYIVKQIKAGKELMHEK